MSGWQAQPRPSSAVRLRWLPPMLCLSQAHSGPSGGLASSGNRFRSMASQATHAQL